LIVWGVCVIGVPCRVAKRQKRRAFGGKKKRRKEGGRDRKRASRLQKKTVTCRFRKTFLCAKLGGQLRVGDGIKGALKRTGGGLLASCAAGVHLGR